MLRKERKSAPARRPLNNRSHSREATLERDEASRRLELVGGLGALVDNLAELLLDLVDGHDLSELGQVNLLHLEEVEDVPVARERVRGASRSTSGGTYVRAWRAAR